MIKLPKSDAFPVDAIVTKSISCLIYHLDLPILNELLDAHPALHLLPADKLPKSCASPNVDTDT